MSSSSGLSQGAPATGDRWFTVYGDPVLERLVDEGVANNRDLAIAAARETLDIYAPIANRLGMSKIKNELEELAFKYLEPKAYESLRARVEAKRKTAEAVIGWTAPLRAGPWSAKRRASP